MRTMVKTPHEGLYKDYMRSLLKSYRRYRRNVDYGSYSVQVVLLCRIEPLVLEV